MKRPARMRGVAKVQGFQDADHPRGVGGRFVESGRVDPGQLALLEDECCGDGLQDADLIVEVQRAVRVEKRRWGDAVDQTDLEGEVILALMEGRARDRAARPEPAERPGGVVGWVNEKAAARKLAHNIAARSASGYSSGPDYAGYRAWQEACEEFTLRLHRLPSAAEKDALADKVRMAFPAQRRPKVGFHRPPNLNTTGLEVVNGNGEAFERTDTALIVDWDDQLGPREVGEVGELAHQAVEQGGRAGKARGRKLAFTAVAQMADMPTPVAGSVSEDRAGTIRKRIRSAGGGAAVAAQLRDGQATAATEAFVSLFGGPLTPSERCELGEFLLSYPNYTDDLVESAVSYATRPSARARTRSLR